MYRVFTWKSAAGPLKTALETTDRFAADHEFQRLAAAFKHHRVALNLDGLTIRNWTAVVPRGQSMRRRKQGFLLS